MDSQVHIISVTGDTPITSDTKMFIMEYDFKVIRVDGDYKEVKHKIEMYTKFEDLLSEYRKHRDMTVFGFMKPCENFKIYQVVERKEITLDAIDSML